MTLILCNCLLDSWIPSKILSMICCNLGSWCQADFSYIFFSKIVFVFLVYPGFHQARPQWWHLDKISLRIALLIYFFVNRYLLWFFNINFIKKRFLTSWCFRTSHTDPELKQNWLKQNWLPYANLWHFATGGHETFYLVKINPEYPDLLFHILLI